MTSEYNLPPHIAQIIHNCIEIRLKTPGDFLKIKETLTRIGIAAHKDRKLFQSCHILHKQGHYYLVHFKELFLTYHWLYHGKHSHKVYFVLMVPG